MHKHFSHFADNEQKI